MQHNDVRILRGAAIPTAVIGVLAVVVAGVTVGGSGALGALVATVVVGVFFAIGLVAVSWAGRISPSAMMAGAVFSTVFKIILLGVLLKVFERAELWDFGAFAWAVIACTVTWMVAEARILMRTKVLYVDPEVKVPGGRNS